MALEEVLNRTPEIRDWTKMINADLYGVYKEMSVGEVEKIRKGELVLLKYLQPIQDYLDNFPWVD